MEGDLKGGRGDGGLRAGVAEGQREVDSLRSFKVWPSLRLDRELSEDRAQGYGVQFFGPKEFYEGEWCSNQRCGWGRMYYSNGDIYEGQWWKDKPDGEGMLRLSECSAPAGPAPKLGPPHLLTTPQRWLRLTPASHAQCPVATPLTPCWPLAAPLSGIRA
ncbi:Hypothetical predicted protein [Marmota monax]|uniref:MORN repeat-containing protein 3 n=1 Tax=Marmota monax TaxID=9995 RepID=A0A5E4ARQ4_MARMO|nr:Hypothetical predicted protein [Marmota monax]